MVDEISAKLGELARVVLIKQLAFHHMTLALTRWAVQYGINYLDAFGYEIGTETSDIVVAAIDGAWAILFHISPGTAQPHGEPHVQISIRGSGTVDRVFLPGL
jgi:hypothetical protein